MKKFAYIVLSILAVCLIFAFGCDTKDKSENENTRITSPLPSVGNPKFSREGHLRKGGLLPHMPEIITPHLKNFPR